MHQVQVARALTELHKATAHYHYDITGLEPDPEIVAFAEKWLVDHVPKPEITDDNYFAELVRGVGRYTAARTLGIDPVIIRRRMRIDADFADRVHVAEALSLEPVLQAARELALDGDMRAINKLLESKIADEYGAKPKIAIQINNGAPAGREISSSNDPIDREILQLKADLAEKQSAMLGLPSGSEVIDIPFEDTDE